MNVMQSQTMKQEVWLNLYSKKVNETLQIFEKNNFVNRLWSKDTSLWKKNADHQKQIAGALGWMGVLDWIEPRITEMLDFSEEIKKAGFKDVVLLGMGGSSLASEVFRLSLPSKKGYPKLHVLDSTDPHWVFSIEKAVEKISKTLFLVSSKSGTTTEPLAFYHYFFDKTKQNGSQFVAITDPGSYLESVAKEKKFRKIFLNPSDIGGRFSALSYFGLVPAALSGKDVQGLFHSARKMMQACKNSSVADNPGVQLGVILGELSKIGRNKMTLIFPKAVESLGLWIEQLVAESSGKEGKGIIPIAGEPGSSLTRYGNDRVFITLHVGKKKDAKIQKLFSSLKKKQHPVIELQMNKPEDLGAELFRWEIATAAACSVLNINAFDQPDVQAAKDLTKVILKKLESTGSLPQLETHLQEKQFQITLSQATHSHPQSTLRDFFNHMKPGDYFGILAFLPFDSKVDQELNQLRVLLRDLTGSATLFGYGPRYLHSTGQLHKGGDNNGVFIVLSAATQKDMPIPNQPFSFAQLESAQALGDFQALDRQGRRAIFVKLKLPLTSSLKSLAQLIKKSIK